MHRKEKLKIWRYLLKEQLKEYLEKRRKEKERRKWQEYREEIRKRPEGKVIGVKNLPKCPFCKENLQSRKELGEHLKKEHQRIAVGPFFTPTEIQFLEHKLKEVNGIGDSIADRAIWSIKGENDLRKKYPNGFIISYRELERRVAITKGIPSKSVDSACDKIVNVNLNRPDSELKSSITKGEEDEKIAEPPPKTHPRSEE